MKKLQTIIGLSISACAFLISGCASTSEQSSANSAAKPAASLAPSSSTDVKLHKDKDIQGVWLAPGFNFTGYDALYIEPTKYAGEVRSNETKQRELALHEVQDRILMAAQGTGLFPKVERGSPTGAGKNLRLANSIIKFEKGGGGARFFAGIYGAGQPHIRVRGEIFHEDKLVCVYEVERSGEGAGARLGGGYTSDDIIIVGDILDLANDLADFFKRAAGR